MVKILARWYLFRGIRNGEIEDARVWWAGSN